MVKIGILALQGNFREHMKILESIGAKAMEVRNSNDLQECSALIIPGGESTTMARLLETSGLGMEIRRRVKKGMPLYGTCAGAILCARKIAGEKRFRPLGIIDIEVKRNDYGRQVDSFEAEVDVHGAGKVNGVFIRAPRILKFGKKAEVLASIGNEPVLVKQGNVIVGTFHPETEGNTYLHKFLTALI